MSALYEIEPLANGYQFITSTGAIYIAYFTEFILLDLQENEVPVVSFGFASKNSGEVKQRYDSKVKHTLIHIIKDFFHKQPDYVCMNSDGKARNRHITFNSWYHELSEGLEKHSSSSESGKQGFYASILFKSTNPQKKKLIASFYFTIDYWGLNDL